MCTLNAHPRTEHEWRLGLGSLCSGEDRRPTAHSKQNAPVTSAPCTTLWAKGKHSRAGQLEVPTCGRVSLGEEQEASPAGRGWLGTSAHGVDPCDCDLDESHVKKFGIYFHLRNSEELLTGVS